MWGHTLVTCYLELLRKSVICSKPRWHTVISFDLKNRRWRSLNRMLLFLHSFSFCCCLNAARPWEVEAWWNTNGLFLHFFTVLSAKNPPSDFRSSLFWFRPSPLLVFFHLSLYLSCTTFTCSSATSDFFRQTLVKMNETGSWSELVVDVNRSLSWTHLSLRLHTSSLPIA